MTKRKKDAPELVQYTVQVRLRMYPGHKAKMEEAAKEAAAHLLTMAALLDTRDLAPEDYTGPTGAAYSDDWFAGRKDIA